MKRILVICSVIISLHLNAQRGGSDSLTKANMASAWQNLNKGGRNAAIAYELFKQCAENGNAEAMNALGVQFKIGMGVPLNKQKAMEWFTKAANAGYTKGWYNLGLCYKENLDFSNAYECFTKAANKQDKQSIYAKAYMLYKGFGCQQNYAIAAKLFEQGSVFGMPNSMHFYGLCLRNGYGVKVNADSAKYWLSKSAAMGYFQATDELMTDSPEHIEGANALANKIQAAQKAMPNNNQVNQYKKIENKIAVSDVAGTYTGYLLKYDWSGQYIIEADSLHITINCTKDSIIGTWQEGDSLNIPLRAVLTPNAVVFNKMQYSKINHYSSGKPELAIFEKASLQLANADGIVYLSGNIQQFIPSRNEPAKPLYIALTRTNALSSKDSIAVMNSDGTTFNDGYSLHAYPNPFNTILNVDFEIKQKCRVSTQLLSIDGKQVYINDAGTLEAGHYILSMQTQHLAGGVYVVKLNYGNKVLITKVMKK